MNLRKMSLEKKSLEKMGSGKKILRKKIPKGTSPGREKLVTAASTWALAALFGALALPAAGSAQTSLSTPESADNQFQCVGQDCPADEAPWSNDDAMPGGVRNERTTQPRPNGTLSDENNNSSNGRDNREINDNNDPNRRFPSRRVIIPEPPPNEFQEFVASSIGHRLPIYGQNLFDHVPTTFAPVDRVPVTDDYVIGPGDEILIRAWGQIDLNGKLVVDRDGNVFLPKVGTLSVAGLKYQQLPQYFRTAIGRVFRNFDLTVSLGQLRSIQVFVLGQARRPGSFTVSSLSTLVDALFSSGGPSATGSMRRIQLKRNNVVVTDFDFYALLLKGDKSKDARLLPGDVIYIPQAGPSIAIAGSVNVPAIYELSGDTTLASAIDMAGGLASTADGQKAVVERVEKHSTRLVEEFALDARGSGREMKDGDLVRIFALSPRFASAVTLRGNVARPGRMEWHSGMRLRDLIPNQNALVTRDYWRATNWVASAGEREDRERSRDYWRATSPLARKGNNQTGPGARPDDPAANAGEGVASQFDPSLALLDQPLGQPFEQQGRQRQPGTAQVSTAAELSRLRNQIAHNSPEINWDYAVIQRLNPEDLTMRLIPFNLGKLVLQGDERENLALDAGDVVTIFSQSDLAVPLAKRSKFVRLEGEFKSAGIYRAEAGETVRHLVERVGGFSPNAYLYGAEFTRESVRVEQQKGLGQLIENLEENLSRNAVAPAGVNPEDVADQRAKLEVQRELIEKLRQVKAEGRVVLDLSPNSAAVRDLPEIALEDGDRLLVPFRPSTVEMLGAVYNKNSFLYRRGQRVDDYLKRAGGPTRDADKARMFVIRADGSILSKQSVRGLWNGGFAALRLMPGDAIIVPQRLNQGSVLKGLRDWSQVFSQFALGAAAIRVIQ
jgi:polysaccharide biosynthesis/export protein